jgi:adenylate cyclase
VCLQSAEEAERAVAFADAIALLERVLPHLADPVERARVVCRIGRDHWLNGASQTAARFLKDGIEALEELGETLEAARSRVVLGRCHWEGAQPELAREEYERARDVLETAGPSAELAMAHMRLAGLDAFELDYNGCLEASRKAVEIAELAGADFERLWALGFLGLGLLDTGEVERGFQIMDDCAREAESREYWQIATNVLWNDLWTRTHMMVGDLETRLERLAAAPTSPLHEGSLAIATSYVKKVRGELTVARDEAERGEQAFERAGYRKMAWRCTVHLAEILVELGRADEAAELLPPPTTRTELQDIVYDGPARVRLCLARGETAEAAVLAGEILDHAGELAVYRETLAAGTEAFVAAGDLERAEALLERGRAHPTTAGVAFLDEMAGRVLLAQGAAAGALPLLRRAVEAARQAGFLLVELRNSTLVAAAMGATVDRDEAERALGDTVDAADRIGARLIRSEAEAAAAALGITLAPPARGPDPTERPRGVVPFGERLVTSLFADVRGYTELTAATAPQELAERMGAFYRFAKTAVERRHGIVDKFAGDAVMATFNASGPRVDHCVQALETALALRDKAALMDLPVGIGIAVGPAVLGRAASDQKVAITGVSVNLAARLQAAAGASEVLLSEEAFRRVQQSLTDRRLAADREELALKGFEGAQVAYRIA